MRVELGGGQWAELKDREQVSHGDRVYAAQRYGAMPVLGQQVLSEMQLKNCYFERILLSWSYEAPVLSSEATSSFDDKEHDAERAAFQGILENLGLEQLNRLYVATHWLVAATVPDFSPSTDPKVDTPNSGD